jgi:hypothetical protein
MAVSQITPLAASMESRIAVIEEARTNYVVDENYAISRSIIIRERD